MHGVIITQNALGYYSNCLKELASDLKVFCFQIQASTHVNPHPHTHEYVTVYGKTRHMGFFVKVEFDTSMISSTIELTRVQVLDRSCASLWR